MTYHTSKLQTLAPDELEELAAAIFANVDRAFAHHAASVAYAVEDVTRAVRRRASAETAGAFTASPCEATPCDTSEPIAAYMLPKVTLYNASDVIATYTLTAPPSCAAVDMHATEEPT